MKGIRFVLAIDLLLFLGACESDKIVGLASPTVSTNSLATYITESEATCGGCVDFDGNDKVFLRGICYSTNVNPDVSNSFEEKGEGMGEFKCVLTNLSDNKKYYYRAFAQNNQGVSYGDVHSFTTKSKIDETSNYAELSLDALYQTSYEYNPEGFTLSTGGSLYYYKFYWVVKVSMGAGRNVVSVGFVINSIDYWHWTKDNYTNNQYSASMNTSRTTSTSTLEVKGYAQFSDGTYQFTESKTLNLNTTTSSSIGKRASGAAHCATRVLPYLKNNNNLNLIPNETVSW